MKTATFETNKGTITAELFEKDAPGTVANFEKLANDSLFDIIRFHRVIPELVVQGGCPNANGCVGGKSVFHGIVLCWRLEPWSVVRASRCMSSPCGVAPPWRSAVEPSLLSHGDSQVAHLSRTA